MLIRSSCRGLIALAQALLLQDQSFIYGDRAAPLPSVAGNPPPPPPSGPEGNIYFLQYLQAELTIANYKGATANVYVEMKTDLKIGIRYPYNIEYVFVIIFPVGSQGLYIWVREDQFCREYFPQGIKNQTECKLFMNEMWYHRPHKKTKIRSVGRYDNFGSTHNGNIKYINSSHSRNSAVNARYFSSYFPHYVLLF